MFNYGTGQDKLTRILRWVARIWGAIIIVITALIFLGEILFPHTEGPYPFYENLMPLSLLISVLGLAIAWRWEIRGGVITIIFSLVNLALYWGIRGVGRGLAMVVLITMPVVIPGILFLICGLRSSEKHQTSST